MFKRKLAALNFHNYNNFDVNGKTYLDRRVITMQVRQFLCSFHFPAYAAARLGLLTECLHGVSRKGQTTTPLEAGVSGLATATGIVQ